jgi:Hint domain
MALNVNLGQQPQTTINTGNVPSDQNINLTLGSNGTLIFDGVNANITNILGAGIVSNTTIEAINGANVTVSGSVGGVSAGSHLSYDIGASSSVTVQAGLLNVSLLDGSSINFDNTGGTGKFTLTPAAINLSLSTAPVVTGLSNGDKIVLTGATSASLNNGVLTFHYPGLLGLDTTTSLNLQGIPAGSSITFDNASDTVVFACFLRGTRIATPNGEIAIEDLVVGDVVLTLNNGRSTIRWIGKRVIDPQRLDRPTDAWPVRIVKGMLTENVPHRDLLISPDHCLLVDDVLIPAKLLINGTSILQEPRHQAFEYFHLEIDGHDAVLAEGMLCETYREAGNRHMFSEPGTAVIGDSYRSRQSIACYPLHYSGPILQSIYKQLQTKTIAGMLKVADARLGI